MKERILLVEDEDGIREMMQYVLETEGYDVVVARNGQEGVKSFFNHRPSLVTLDLRMPVMDGWTLLERIREVSQVPVIILTAMGQEQDAVRGLRSGADDYVVKPVRLKEFIARIEAQLRKANPIVSIEDQYTDSILRVDFARHDVYLKSAKLDFTPQEFRLLAALVRHAGTVLSTDRLIDACWGEVGGPENVRVYIGYLRRKLEEDPTQPRLIQTVREFGYRYCPPEK
ncbi:MAG: response regulator transcription factor [Chloroflexota bacterium]